MQSGVIELSTSSTGHKHRPPSSPTRRLKWVPHRYTGSMETISRGEWILRVWNMEQKVT
ncbi:hypothetical protein YC2023_094543 [Brassica napus]